MVAFQFKSIMHLIEYFKIILHLEVRNASVHLYPMIDVELPIRNNFQNCHMASYSSILLLPWYWWALWHVFRSTGTPLVLRKAQAGKCLQKKILTGTYIVNNLFNSSASSARVHRRVQSPVHSSEFMFELSRFQWEFY